MHRSAALATHTTDQSILIEGSYFMKNAVKYKDGSYLMKGSLAYQLYDDARYHKDAGVRKEAEKRLKKHMEEVSAKYKEMHGL